MKRKIVSIAVVFFMFLSSQNLSVFAIDEESGSQQNVVIEKTENIQQEQTEESEETITEEDEEPSVDETDSELMEESSEQSSDSEEEENIEEDSMSGFEESEISEETENNEELMLYDLRSAYAANATPVLAKAKPDQPEGYESPAFEEGKIHVNGFYVVASDGQLSEYLEWSFPYRNPLQEGIYPDPGRPYRYVMWQSKKNADGAWGNWETRSPVDVDAKDGSVWVLNVAPDNIAGSQNLKNWMDTAVRDYDGSMTTIGRNVIEVKTVTVSAFNANPAGILKTDPVTGNASNEYEYSVIIFGTCDSNGSQDINATAQAETVKFYESGGGLMFGHDTVQSSYGNFAKFAAKEYLNITLQTGAVTVGHSSSGNAYVKVVDTGFLTSRPWNLEGKTLTIPNAHVLGQRVGGAYSNASASQPRVWMQFSDASGNVNSVPGTKEAPFTHALGNGYLETNNYYLITNGRIAMIQTGHSNGAATTDEQMVIANTLIYLAQSTTTTTAKDASFIDEAAPSKASGKVVSVTPTADLLHYTAKIELSGSEDFGTEYAYRIQALPQTTISDGSDYNEIWSTTATNPEDPTVYRDLALSGLRGYYIGAVNESSAPMKLNSVNINQVIAASGSEDQVSYETGVLEPGKTYYVHAYAVDYQGNVSEDLIIPIAVSKRVVNFHFHDEENKIEQTLLKSDGTAATMPIDVVREGYRFLGWYEDEAGTKGVDPSSVFDESYGDEIEVHAKWIKTWTVTLGQRGEGSVSVQSSKGGRNPFDEGSDVIVSYAASEGHEVKKIWLDGVEMDPNESGKLLIKGIKADHYVLVEFEEKEEEWGEEEPVIPYEYYSIETELMGGGSGSKITPSIRLEKKDERCKNYEVKWEAASGYEVKEIWIDGIERRDLVGKNSVRFNQVTCDHQIQVVMKKAAEKEKKIQVKTELVGGPGEVTPSKEVKLNEEMTVTASVSDERNYEIASMKVYDKTGADISSRYSINTKGGNAVLTAIQEDLRVVVTLQPKKQAGTVVIAPNDLLRVETSKSGEGEISGSKIVERGSSETVEWQAAEGWKVSEVIVDKDMIYYGAKEDTVMMARAFSLNVEEESEMPFEEIEENHSVHVTFTKLYEEEEDPDVHEVITALVGDGVGTITPSNKGLETGENYEVGWETEKNHEVMEVWVDGELREDLKEASTVEFTDIQEDHEVIVVVKRVLNIDTDGDGKPDVNVDTDEDGKPDVNIDTDDDGKPDINIVDKDGDGKPDNIDPEDKEEEKKPNVNVDTDGDGKPDVNIDTDGDGKPDINIVDKDKDGKPDYIDPKDPDQDKTPDVNIVDKDGDGKPDDLDDLTKEELKEIKPDINIDTTRDGRPNINIDTNGDGKPDINIDTDGDGKADTNIDADGNGIIDADEFQAAVNTGDQSNQGGWLMMMGGSLIMMILLMKKKRELYKRG